MLKTDQDNIQRTKLDNTKLDQSTEKSGNTAGHIKQPRTPKRSGTRKNNGNPQKSGTQIRNKQKEPRKNKRTHKRS